ncbi:polycystin-1 [Scleropages formosus]|uniref:polycystin-1 n=1 Tax=Scleropages formosus TaxID=113540 RepID=UPI0010FAA5D6|nr:polycystin-1-like [Scleropages formosus]
MMLFPGLWFSHTGRVLSVELVAQRSDRRSYAKVQILRPYCSPNQHLVPPGCSSFHNPFSCCSAEPLCNTTGGCASGYYWCHLLEICVPVSSPCSPYASETSGQAFSLPPRYPAATPFYHLVADLPLHLPPSSEHVHVNMMLSEKEINVYPDDILAVQHTGQEEGFLHCPQSSTSPWRQSYLSVPGPEWGGWLEGGLTVVPAGAQWLDGVVCDLRVLYADTVHGYAVSSGQSEAGHQVHTRMGTVSPSRSAEPGGLPNTVMEVAFVHPAPNREGQIHIPVNTPTIIVIKIRSGANATSFWSDPVSQTGVPFLPSCPLPLAEFSLACNRETPDTLFSHTWVVLSHPGSRILNISVLSQTGSRSVSVQLRAHRSVLGLSVLPRGDQRMLVNIPQVFTAMVRSGTPVEYTWVIDNLTQFAYKGQIYSVVFNKPAEYKLVVTAQNPVSSQSLEVKLTADNMIPLAEPTFLSIREIMPVETPQLFTFRVKVDVSVGVTFWWDFGDGSPGMNHSFPSADESRDRQLEPAEKQIYLQDSVSHTYLQPGDYVLRVQVFNIYDKTGKDTLVKVRSPLTKLLISSTPPVPIVNQTFHLEVLPWPSSCGILYTWNFGGSIQEVTGVNRTVSYAERAAGVYNVTVRANNTVSVLTTWMALEIVEKISGFQLSYNGPNELGSSTVIRGNVLSGTSLHWTYDMGDGSLFENISESSISYTYKSPRNYSVRITVKNAVSQVAQSIIVEIYELTISEILPCGCLESGREIYFRAIVSAIEAKLTFCWNFGDGTPETEIRGNSTASHMYSLPGSYETTVKVFSSVGFAFYRKYICTEAPITAVNLHSSKEAVAVGEEVCFNTFLHPQLDKLHRYQFLWNGFDNNSFVRGPSNNCFVFKEDGNYQITVEARNNVSTKRAKASVVVQKPVLSLSVKNATHHGAVVANRSYLFWVETSSGTNVTFLWDFGDGSSRTQGENVSHVFTSAGQFEVFVTALNAVSRLSLKLEVTVMVPLSNLRLQVTKPIAGVGEEILITAVTDVMKNVSFYWSVEPSIPAKLGTSNFTYAFPRAGIYHVHVTAENTVSKQVATATIDVLEHIKGVQITSESLISMKYLPTQENVLLTASVTSGSDLTYSWLVYHSGKNRSVHDGENFQLFAEAPGDIWVELTVFNKLGEVNTTVSLRAEERISGVTVHATGDAVAVGKPVEISVSVRTGSNLQYLWYVGTSVLPMQSALPFLLHIFQDIGSSVIKVSVSNALGSSEAMKLLTVQEEVQEVNFKINGKECPFFVTSDSELVLLGSVKKGNYLNWAWKSFSNNTGFTVLGNKQSVLYSFSDPGVYKLLLNASNDISWQVVSHEIIVQEAIRGLSLSINSYTVCSGDPIIIRLTTLTGSDVVFSLQFDNSNLPVNLDQKDFITKNLSVGSHTVTARAWNHVSTCAVNVTVTVVEKILGLKLVNCCTEALESRKEISFEAEVLNGTPTMYHWTFGLMGFQPWRSVGPKVLYSPPSNGSLVIHVEVSNGFCSLSLNKTLSVRWPVRTVRLVSNSTVVFTGDTIAFSAITDHGSNLRYKWEFGDTAEATLITDFHTMSHRFNLPGSYVVQVTVFNNISQVVAQLSIEAKKLECIVPRVSLIQKQSVIIKSRPSHFEAIVDLQGCVAYKASHLWEVFLAPGCKERDSVPLVGVSGVNAPMLTLPKHALTVGSYCLRFTAVLLGTPLLQERTITVNVVHSELVPLIKGGSHRLWSNHTDLLLDGTESHDPDSEPGNGEPLQFFWDYSAQNTVTPTSLQSQTPRNCSTFLVPRELMHPGSMHLFTLTVKKTGRQPASTSQSVVVQADRTLSVSVACVSCGSLSSLRFNYGRPVALSGSCPSCNGSLQYKWSAKSWNGDVLKLSEVTTTTGDISPDLVVRPGILLGELSYTFTLNVSERGLGICGSASLTLLPNRPPHGGVCTLTPEAAVHLLETMVIYNCSGWKDDDGDAAQLIYALKVEVCEEYRRSCNRHTLYRGTQQNHGTFVPLGHSVHRSIRSVITVLVQLEDNLGSTVTALNRTLTILQPKAEHMTTGWLRNKSQSELWTLIQQGKPQEVISYSIALSSQLSQVEDISEQDQENRMAILRNMTETLASLPVSSLQDAARISSALARCSPYPSKLACEGCQEKVLEATAKMITVIGEQAEPGEITPIEAGGSILQVLGSMIALGVEPSTTSVQHNRSELPVATDTAVTAYSQVGELMRSLMRSRMRGEEALALRGPRISATGRRSDPAGLLCSEPSDTCPFYVPPSLGDRLRAEREEVVQILVDLDSGGALLSDVQPPISTTLAAMEFLTPQGRPIPVENLPPDQAIHVLLQNRLPARGRDQLSKEATTLDLVLQPEGSLNFSVRAVETEPDGGLFIAFNFSLLPGSGFEVSGQVTIVVGTQPFPSHSQHAYKHELPILLSTASPALEETIFLTPLRNRSGQELYVSLNSSLNGRSAQLSVRVFGSLCRYFSTAERRWSSEGLRPLSGSSRREAHCLTRHLTAFGASIFVHPDAVVLLPPPAKPSRNVAVGLVCGFLLLLHLLIALIAHKLDHLDGARLSCVPLCGHPGRYQYRVLVKTGWVKGSGTTAHVGLSLYGLNRSGSRHLRQDGAFQRNGLDDFQLETDANLGEIWKIRIWHDNTGLDPSWYLQHVVVWDLQTDNMFFFLVEDWLSVENEKNDGMVEKEVLASCPQDLRQFRRILRAQLTHGMFERHIWVSLWERPAHSGFTRTQRVTCCALVLHLYLAASAVWYGAVGSTASSGPVSARLLVNAEALATGMTVAVLIFPLQQLFCFLFRNTCSKVTVEESAPPSPVCHTVEMDVHLDHLKMTSSSFLSLPRGLDSVSDAGFPSTESLESKNVEYACWNTAEQRNERTDLWMSSDSIFDVPELLAAPPLAQTRLLKRKKAQLQLYLGSPAGFSGQVQSDQAFAHSLWENHLTLFEEDPIESVAPELSSSTPSDRVTSDSSRRSPCRTVLSDTRWSSCSGLSEPDQDRPPYGSRLHRPVSSLSMFSTASTFLPSPSPDSVGSASVTRIGVARSAPSWRFPPWMLMVTYLLAGLVLGGCLALITLYGSSFSNSILLMWLISAVSAFLTSALLLEPLKVCVQALFLAAVVRPVDPEVEERLSQEPAVKRGPLEQGDKVRPPCGYGLLHAKEEAHKVRALKSLMKSCMVHMLFLLAILLVNYQNTVQDTQVRLLRSAVTRSLLSASPGTQSLRSLAGWTEVWQWMDRTLVPHLHQSPMLCLVGLPRLQRIQSQDSCCAEAGPYGGSRSASLMPPVSASSQTPPVHPSASALYTSSKHRLLSWVWPPWFCRNEGGSEDIVDLGNSSDATRQILTDAQSAHWLSATTRSLSVEFTQYHRETSVFISVTVVLECSWMDTKPSISVHPFLVPPSSSGPDLQVALLVLLLCFALSFLGSELWAVVRGQGQGWCSLHLLVSLLSLASAALRLSFLSATSSSLSRLRSAPQTFVSFRSSALLGQASAQLSALLLTLLILKMAGALRFVRRWVVFGRVLQATWRDLCWAAVLLVLLLLFFTHIGCLLFSSSVGGFRTAGQVFLTLMSALRGRGGMRQLCERHPVLGVLYWLSLLGASLWLLGRLCGAVLLHSYRTVQAEMYWPTIETQDYQMVEFFIKRLKLWMGLSKTKEFRHKVKFEGMVSPPSRSSQGSEFSGFSEDHSPSSLRLASATSLGSEDSGLSENYDIQSYLDRLLPAVNALLSQFDRVNQVTDNLCHLEQELLRAQIRISQRQRQQGVRVSDAWRRSLPSASPQAFPPRSSSVRKSPLPCSFARVPALPRTPTSPLEVPFPWQYPHLVKAVNSAPESSNGPVRRVSGTDAGVGPVPVRRAWHSSTSHSADVAQRTAQATGSSPRARPRSEEGNRRPVCEHVPVKRRAWHPEGETGKD